MCKVARDQSTCTNQVLSLQVISQIISRDCKQLDKPIYRSVLLLKIYMEFPLSMNSYEKQCSRRPDTNDM